ncbi:MAG: CoA transferase [Rhodospirillaceae bacterium]|jgi:crotonobetainyl-CoA:carnitine CoA-transferase CaiB-like acyl-CoA transferase|nr:CoA transferase [Rhodospirillaceae bacterium]MBT4687237.1 CoA transferase [Rhodospirillaceae bacterium]MBT5082732.1 CoA transferase [Rhodospirillaceae bacterium]MBT5524104.1 CoA transferase [Rhodospirillaceae bacterium]MBT5880781.1 CoA transferase [Rhodospirillaceae bacterium]
MTEPQPMAGVRVLDLATFIAAPFTATILGEFGAEVIKVEQPGSGDPMRKFGTATELPDSSLAWLSEARNKQSITLNLKAPQGVDLFKRLVAQTDVLCENFRPGTLEKWGLGYDVLRAINPKLVMLQVSGYGQDGPYRDRPGFARIAHAVGGLTYLAGMPGEAPVTPGSTSLADYISGLFGAIGVLMALRSVEQTGQGQTVDVALFESIFRVLDELAPVYAKHGTVREREGLGTRNVCPHGHFPTKDGEWVAVACTSDKIWDRMARNVLDRPDLADSHPTTADRVADRDLIDGAVRNFTLANPSAEVVAICAGGEVPCATINSIADIFADPQFDARGTLHRMQHALLGEVVVPDVLPRLSGTPGTIENLGPALGNWNDEVYGKRLGLSPSEREELQKNGVI